MLREFKMKTDKSGNYGQIMKTLNILFTMYHAYELMIRHGLRAFCKFYESMNTYNLLIITVNFKIKDVTICCNFHLL